MLLVIQGILALVGTLRGHGFTPWAIILTAFLIGLGFGFMGVEAIGLYLLVDISAAIFLAGFAFSPAEVQA